MGWHWQSLCSAHGSCLLLRVCFILQDINLKMPRNNQLLHFAFREDKQWKLQQVLVTLDAYPSVASARFGQ